ncbi:MAG: outer membrane lipoprotein-sorting protein [Gammaproteobacteria bacterium]|nr:outer membrane lipoprotein-sorting protein [Gammaproteobacteria bacterium]
MSHRLLQIFSLWLFAGLSCSSQADNAQQLIRQAIDNYRGITSYSEATMTIHRPDWQRVIAMKAWTEGLDKSLVRITAPKKDKDSGSLLLDDNMWSYAPKINRVIKIPSSMSGQSWMGSDFSNNDIARADDIIDNYTHTLLETKNHNGHKLFIIQSVPHEDAPVVWGKEVLQIRDDHVLLEHAFYDQDGILIKKLTTSEIKTISGKTIATTQRMQKADKENEWTEFHSSVIKFNIIIPKNTFTLSNLRNPR